MTEEGRIVEIKGQVAGVEMARSAGCEKCGACLSKGPETMVVETTNQAGAKVGDWVRVEISSRLILKANFLVFMVPVIGLLGGYFIGRIISPREVVQVSGAMAGFFVSLIFLRLYDKKIKIKNLPRIIAIIKIADSI